MSDLDAESMSRAEEAAPSLPGAWATEWLEWWKGLTPAARLGPALAIAAYWIVLHFGFHALQGDRVATGALLLALHYAGPRVRPFHGFILPLLLTAIIYDSQRFYGDLIRGPIHVDEPYRFDKFFFGISTDAGVLTPNEWWQLHTHPALDLITGFFYLTFILMFVGIAGWFRFKSVGARAGRVMWSFLWLNLIGYSTYYWYAAAPPWYVSIYGLGPANLEAPANPAGCIRFDQLLGASFFTGMYGKSADVFGAIPSLHIAYPLLAVLYAYQFRSLRAFSVIFYVVMCFSAVYLNHHYVLDLIWGSVYAVLVWWLMDLWLRRRDAGRSPSGPLR
jgi:membrane-associated phospholipid phosphatase